MFEQENRRVAVLIDAENVPAIYADKIMENAESLGRIVQKEMYGSGPALCSWTEPALRYVLRPNITLRQTKGKNTSDIALTIGAMDLLIADIADDVVIVSSDSDFSALAIRLRTAGKNVIGMGEVKSNAMWKVACSKFITLETSKPTAVPEPIKAKTETVAVPKKAEPDIDPIEEALEIVRTEHDQNGFITIDLLVQRLREEYPELLGGKRVLDKALAMLEGNENFDIRREKRQGRRTPVVLIREHVEEETIEEPQEIPQKIEEKKEDPMEAVRESIIRMLNEKNGHMPISAMFPELGRIKGYRGLQKRSGKKPQQFLIDNFGELFDTEDINGGLWAIVKGENFDAEAVIEADDDAAMVTETAEESVPEEIVKKEPEAAYDEPQAIETEGETPAKRLESMLVADGYDAEAAATASVILTENNPLQAYNLMRKSFGNKDGGNYYNTFKAYLKKL